MKKLTLFFALILAVAATVGFASCSDDDDPAGEFVFEAGILEINGSDDDAKAEMKEIESIYLAALGVNDATFTLKGTESECKDKIAAACKNAEKEIERRSWKCSFTYTVFLVNKMKTIYSYSYPKK